MTNYSRENGLQHDIRASYAMENRFPHCTNKFYPTENDIYPGVNTILLEEILTPNRAKVVYQMKNGLHVASMRLVMDEGVS